MFGVERSLCQLVLKFAMKINICDWTRDDLAEIQRAWLDCSIPRPDMQLRTNSAAAMKHWLTERFEEPQNIGFVARQEDVMAGFLIGRIDDWESVPPIIKPRRIGIIDAVYVDERFRRQGIGTRLLDRAVQAMREANAVAVETIYEACNEAPARIWRRAGFAPWMIHAYRMF